MYHIIVNPGARSGQGLKQWKRLHKELERAKITYIVHFTKSAQDATAYTRSITDRRLYEHNAVDNRIIVLGGDGTLNCVLNGIDDPAHTLIAYLPAGTSNDFAKALQISDDPLRTLQAFSRHGQTCSADIGVASCGKKTRRFAVSSGIGYDAAICREALHAPAKDFLNRLGLGRLTYVIIALKQLISLQSVSCDLYLDDQPPIHMKHFYFAAFMQQPFEGGGFAFCPKANPRDGLLDVCFVGNISKLFALSLFPLAAKGRHIGRRGIHYYRGRRIRIVTSKPLCVHTDGEILGSFSELSLSTEDLPLLYRSCPIDTKSIS